MTRQLRPIDLVAPGFAGLNTEGQGSLLSPAFATEARNAVIDPAGRLAARGGYTDLTTTDIPANPPVKTVFEFKEQDTSTEIILAWDGGISNDITDPVSGDISGAVTDADGTWQFQNFNNKCIGFQAGQKLIVYTGAGTFATVVESSGTAPSGGVGLCAYGRVWQLDTDGKTIKYSGLLDETDWGGVGAGLIDMSAVWTDGTDEVVAIAAFNSALVVFGRKHIVFWVDGQGSEIGLNPSNIYVSDIITGTGCLSQFTVQKVGETDMLFLGPNGVQSLQRVIQERSNPIANLSKNVRTDLLSNVGLETLNEIRSTFNPIFGFYVLSLPNQGKTYVLDQRRRFRDEDGDELSIVTTWDLAPTALTTATNQTLYIGTTNGVGTYGTSNTDAGVVFRLIYQSPWLALGEEIGNILKILKRFGVILFVRNETTILFKWATDFKDTFKTISRTVDGDADAQWNVGEWGIMEWSGGLSLRIIKVPARDKGQYYRIALEADVNGEFALQQAELFPKLGRTA